MSTWYSALEVAIETSLPVNKNGYVKQTIVKDWLLAKAREGKLFKSQELEWSGLNEWLALQPTLISKESVLAYLKDNGVQISEVHYGIDYSSSNMKTLLDEGYQIERDMSGYLNLLDANGDEVEEPELLPEDLDIAWQNLTGQVESDVQYEAYTVPGGENYQELLLILPDAQSNADEGKVTFKHPDDIDGFLTDLSIEGFENLDYGRVDDGIHKEYVEFNGLTRYELESFIKIAEDNYGTLTFNTLEGGAPQFRLGHFKEPNIITHIRFNEHLDTEGKRVLFINEIQSDWGQEGRKKGFDGSETLYEVRNKNGKLEKIVRSEEDAEQHLVYVQKKFPHLSPEVITDGWSINSVINKTGVPKAPFVTTTDAWVSLALKRMMLYAANNNYDKVALISGQQSADLYDLSKKVRSVEAVRKEDGNYYLIVNLFKDKIEYFNDVKESDLESVIGKDLADKIIKQPEGDHEYKGVQLRLGGEGMIAFYDSIVPKIAKKLLNTVDGTLSTVHLNSNKEQLGFDLTPEVKSNILKGLPLFRLINTEEIETESITESEIQTEILKRMDAWPSLPEISLVQNISDLPFIAPANTQAVAFDNHIYLVVPNIHSIKDVQLAIGHEAIGHIAFSNLFDSEREMGEYLHRVMQAAKVEGSKLNALLQEVEEKYPFASDSVKAKELVSLAVEHSLDGDGNLEIELAFVKSLYVKAASFVRSIGLDMPFSNFELQGLIVDAGRLLSEPTPHNKTLESLNQLNNTTGINLTFPDRESGNYRGSISQSSSVHAMQELGRGLAVVHDKRDLPKGIKKGNKYSIKYDNKKGIVSNLDKSRETSLTI